MSGPVALAAIEQGARPPVVILHGVFGSARNWGTVVRKLAERRRVFALDLRNHGDSPWADTMSYPEQAEDVLAFIRSRQLGAVALLGHSMGGKAAMLAALEMPDQVERLVVVDVAPAAYPPTLRAYAEAMLAIDLGRAKRRADVDAQLAGLVPEAPIRAFLLQNLVAGDGGFRWRLNLSVIAREMDALSGFPEVDGVYEGPCLFVRGERSDYVQPRHEQRIQTLFPRAEIATVAGAGHWVHAEQPARFIETVEPFFAQS